MAEHPAPGIHMRYEAARLELARISVSAGHPLRTALTELAIAAASALEVARISIWLLIDEGAAIRCEFLYQPATRHVFEGTVLHAREFPTYFSALATRRVIAVVDTEHDPMVEEFRVSYLRPLGITAMLDAPLYAGGSVAGIVCHEHVGPVRQWSEAEREFAASVADAITRLHAESQRLQAENTLGSFQSHVMGLQRAGTLGRLAAGMAHDFRNILNAVSGFSELMLAAAPDNEELHGYGREMQEAVRRGTQLTQELLALGQEQPCRPAVTDLARLLGDYSQLLAMATASGVRLQMHLAAPVSRVFVDVAQIERAVLNLVVNASDALPDGGTVEVSLFERETTPGGGHYVVIEVADNGTGMDASTQELMFEPFFTTKGDHGTGLGLSIVQQIVRHAGGHIEVESAPGEGTRIRLCLPCISNAG